MSTVHHLKAENFAIGARSSAPRGPRKPSLASTLKAARKAGAGHVEIIDGKIVIALAGEPVKPTGNDARSPDRNEWDAILPGGDHGTR
jgi:hypothetical protein